MKSWTYHYYLQCDSSKAACFFYLYSIDALHWKCNSIDFVRWTKHTPSISQSERVKWASMNSVCFLQIKWECIWCVLCSYTYIHVEIWCMHFKSIFYVVALKNCCTIYSWKSSLLDRSKTGFKTTGMAILREKGNAWR